MLIMENQRPLPGPLVAGHDPSQSVLETDYARQERLRMPAGHHEGVEESEHKPGSDGVAYDDDIETQCDSPSTPGIEAIEDLVLSFLTQLASVSSTSSQDSAGLDGESTHEAQPTSTAKRRSRKVHLHLANRRKHSVNEHVEMRTMTFPRNGKGASSKPFAQLFRVMDFAHEGLLDNTPSTKRDIYYRDVELFKSQATVDRLVDDLAATFNLERSDLNVRATAKGIICGSALQIHLHSGDVIILNDSEGTLIPVGDDVSAYSLVEDVSWVLIVEKDAVFQTLCKMKITNCPDLPGRGLLITGKGYPDIATREIVKTLSDNLPLTIPILALVDGDPFGIDILSVFKYGSLALRHENDKLAAHRVEWLGLWASELIGLGVDHDSLIPITAHDERKALSMLSRPPQVMSPQWRKELMRILHTRRKAEIEILSNALPGLDILPWQQHLEHPCRRLGPGIYSASSSFLSTPAAPHDPALIDAKSTSQRVSLEDVVEQVSYEGYSRSAESLHSSSNPCFHAGCPSPSSAPPILRYLAKKICRYVNHAGTTSDSTDEM
ncbi:hypothetical protein HGRIS_002808 [Hohenbuehelia grisea]|uniref:DNA topoisomerase (ATP-hydrolyzing) n=1 Tax=Hohenbuehelia grisea TaxID=104357 RepID=A0ABR3JNI4_9AGAR